MTPVQDITTAKAARALLAKRCGVDLTIPDEPLRGAISTYGESVLVGLNPQGKPETARQLYERAIGPWPAAKRGKK